VKRERSGRKGEARAPLGRRGANQVADEVASDEDIIARWLHGRPRHTSVAYAADAARFRASAKCAIRDCRLAHLQAFAEELAHPDLALSDATRVRVLAAVRSLFAFAHKMGYLQSNPGAGLRVPKVRHRLAERILTEGEVARMIDLEPSTRNRAILTLFHGSGIRLSHLVGLSWRDLQPRGEAGQISVYGKGAKTRQVILSPSTWAHLAALRPSDATSNTPVFASRERDPATGLPRRLSARQVDHVVRAAARRAGIDDRAVSPHWLRHSHASHALDRGAPAHLVQATLGHESLATTGRYAHARPAESSSRFLPV